MYNYTKEDLFQKLAETKITNVIDVTYIEISRDGSRVAILLPEPTNCLKILEYSNQPEGIKFKEILSIPMNIPDFKELKFNPMNKNFIFLLTKSKYDLIEIRLNEKNGYFYEAILKARISVNDELKNKINRFIELMEDLKETEREKPLDELIWKIYEELK